MSSGRAFQTMGGIKSKTVIKLFDRFMNRRIELWNGKEIITTLTVPGTICLDLLFVLHCLLQPG